MRGLSWGGWVESGGGGGVYKTIDDSIQLVFRLV